MLGVRPVAFGARRHYENHIPRFGIGCQVVDVGEFGWQAADDVCAAKDGNEKVDDPAPDILHLIRLSDRMGGRLSGYVAWIILVAVTVAVTVICHSQLKFVLAA